MAELTPDLKAQIRKVSQIFMLRSALDVERLYPGGEGTARFAHYTSPEAAVKIVRTKRLWMRDAGCMADYREIDHRHDLHVRLFNQNNRRKDLVDALDVCVPGVAMKGLSTFDQHWPSIRRETFSAGRGCGAASGGNGRRTASGLRRLA